MRRRFRFARIISFGHMSTKKDSTKLERTYASARLSYSKIATLSAINLG